VKQPIVFRRAEAGAYGDRPIETFDLYGAPDRHSPAVIFVHGGGWRGGAARDFAFPAEMLVRAGISFVTLDFSSIDDVGGELGTLVDQIRRAICWLARNYNELGIDGHSLFLAGHSSGAHLAAMALSTDWRACGLTSTPLCSALLVSGIYDLRPLRRTSRCSYVRIDDTTERDMSPIDHVSSLESSLHVTVGSNESPEFLRQAKDYASAVRQARKKVSFGIVEGYNHFEILETLASPHDALGRQLIDSVMSSKPRNT